MSSYDLLLMIVFILVVSVSLCSAEALKRVFNIESEISRKTFHITAGTVCIAALFWVPHQSLHIMSASFFIIVLPFTIKYNLFKEVQGKARGYGTALFAAGYLFLILFFWGRKEIIVASMIALTFGDSMAALIGKKYGKRLFRIGGNYRSFEGSLAFFFLCLSGFVFSLSIFKRNNFFYNLWIGSICALLTTSMEAISYSDADNLTIPLMASFTLSLMLNNSYDHNVIFSLIILLLLSLAIISYKLKYVDCAASIGGFLIGSLVFGTGGWAWLIPISVFFFSISMISHYSSQKFDNPFSEKKGGKDIFQIYANGGIGALIAVLYYFLPCRQLYYSYLAVIATVNSDTWSAEIGALSPKTSIVSLPGFKRVPKGMSGGVTALGLSGGVIGTVLIALFIFMFSNTSDNIMLIFIIISASGFLGNIADSILGSTMQGVYTCPVCQRTTEKKNLCSHSEKLILIKGFTWMNNDLVNFISSIIGGACACLLTALF